MNIGKQNQHQSIDEITAKMELSIEIARIALACPSCGSTVKKLVQRYTSGDIETDTNIVTDLPPVGGHSSFQETNKQLDSIEITRQYK